MGLKSRKIILSAHFPIYNLNQYVKEKNVEILNLKGT